MKTSKDEEITFVFKVTDPEKATKTLAPLYATMMEGEGDIGVRVIASARANVSDQLDKEVALTEKCADYLSRNCLGDEEAEELLDELKADL